MSSRETAGDRLSPAEIEDQLRNLSESDWGRAQSLARFCANGVVGWEGDALLAEAVVKLLSGERIWRPGVAPLVTLKLIMHSIASNERKRGANGPIDHFVEVDAIGEQRDDENPMAGVQAINEVTPEDIADARLLIEHLSSLVSGNEDEEMVLLAWLDGLGGKAAAEEVGMEMNRYEAARKRIQRKLKPFIKERAA